jgi:hypothetical protein
MHDDSRPPTDTIPSPPPDAIPSGGAQAALILALEQLMTAYRRLEAVTMGIARALDGEVRR